MGVGWGQHFMLLINFKYMVILVKIWWCSNQNIFAPQCGLHAHSKAVYLHTWSLHLHINGSMLLIPQYAILVKIWWCSDQLIFSPQSGLHIHSKTVCFCE